MEPLNLKLVRDLSGMKGQAIAVALVMACGLAVMIMARSLILSLESARDAYYTSCRFADIFCDLKRAPNALRSRLAEIAGVAGVETRVTGSLILDLPGVKEPADGEILSVPEDRPQQLNLLFLRVGRLPEPGSNDEVVVGEAFAAWSQPARHHRRDHSRSVPTTAHRRHRVIARACLRDAPRRDRS